MLGQLHQHLVARSPMLRQHQQLNVSKSNYFLNIFEFFLLHIQTIFFSILISDFVPWIPRTAPLATTARPPPPALIPIAKKRQTFGIDPDVLRAQVNINTKALQELDELKRERAELLAKNEQMAKKNLLTQSKLATTTEQLSYLKKKLEKNPKSSDAPDQENQDPNKKHE